MTALNDRYPDLLEDTSDPDLVRLVAGLDTMRDGSPSHRADAAIRNAMIAGNAPRLQASTLRLAEAEKLPRQYRHRQLAARVGAAATAAAIALLGGTAYLHDDAPAPVSAQTVLRHAAAASPGADAAVHATYRVSAEGGGTSSGEVWIGFDGNGTATQLVLNMHIAQDGQSGSEGILRLTASGSRLEQIYGPATRAQSPLPPPSAEPATGITAASVAGQSLEGVVMGTLLARKLSNQPGPYQMHQETLDNVPVYALTTSDGITYYFNAQTYVLQGADWLEDGTPWHAREQSYTTMPISAVPPGTFGSTNAPDGAQPQR